MGTDFWWIFSTQIAGNRTPITTNDLIEGSLGKFGIICVKDPIHEVMSNTYPLFGIPCISDEKLLMQPLLSNIKGLIFSDQYMLVRKIPFIIWFFLTMSVLRFCQLDPTLSMHPTSCGLLSWTLRQVAGGRRSLRREGEFAFLPFS